MRPVIRVYLYDENGERFFGEGPLRLLHAVEETGSLRSAAQSMEMAYTKALHLLRRAEKVLRLRVYAPNDRRTRRRRQRADR